MTEELNRGCPEFTLGVFDGQAIVSQVIYDGSQMTLVFLQVTRKSEAIIDVAGIGFKVFQDAIHRALKGGTRIPQAEAGVA